MTSEKDMLTWAQNELHNKQQELLRQSEVTHNATMNNVQSQQANKQYFSPGYEGSIDYWIDKAIENERIGMSLYVIAKTLIKEYEIPESVKGDVFTQADALTKQAVAAGEQLNLEKLTAALKVSDTSRAIIDKARLQLATWTVSQRAYRELAMSLGEKLGIKNEEITQLHYQNAEKVINNQTQYKNNVEDLTPMSQQQITRCDAGVREWISKYKK